MNSIEQMATGSSNSAQLTLSCNPLQNVVMGWMPTTWVAFFLKGSNHHIQNTVLSDGAHSLLGQFTNLTFSREENKDKVTRCGFFNLSNDIFWVFYKKFDLIILKI